MPLIARHVCQTGTKRIPPDYSLTLIAIMAEIKGVCHFRNVLFDKCSVAAITVTGKDQRAAANILTSAIMGQRTDAGNAPVCAGKQCIHLQTGCDIQSGICRCTQQCGLQRGPSAFWHGMHAQHRMAGIKKTVNQNEGQAVVLMQPGDGWP